MSGDGEDRPPADVVDLPSPDAGAAASEPPIPIPVDGEPDPGAGPRVGVLDDEGDRLPLEQLESPARLRSVIESVMLVAERPLAPARLAQILGGSVEAQAVREVLEDWAAELEEREAGIRLMRVAGGYRLRTDSVNAPWIRALTRRRPVRLSRAALETLAIVAYRQPATRADVDDVRGVDSSVVLRSLLEKDLLRIVGRKEEPGRPMIYGTTRRFLEVFGLGTLSDLPSLREFTQLSVGEQESLFGDHVLLEDETGVEREREDGAAPSPPPPRGGGGGGGGGGEGWADTEGGDDAA